MSSENRIQKTRKHNKFDPQGIQNALFEWRDDRKTSSFGPTGQRNRETWISEEVVQEFGIGVRLGKLEDPADNYVGRHFWHWQKVSDPLSVVP